MDEYNEIELNKKGTTTPFLVIGFVFIIVLGTAIALRPANKPMPTNTLAPTASQNAPIQAQTFTVDESGEPLTQDNSATAAQRAAEKAEAMEMQLEGDMALIDQLNSIL